MGPLHTAQATMKLALTVFTAFMPVVKGVVHDCMSRKNRTEDACIDHIASTISALNTVSDDLEQSLDVCVDVSNDKCHGDINNVIDNIGNVTSALAVATFECHIRHGD